MRETRGRWGELRVDDYIRDRTGTVWRLCVEDRGYFRAKNRAGELTTISPKPADTPVTILRPGEEDAIPLLRDKLGARVIAEKVHGEELAHFEPWEHMRALGLPLDEFRSHLWMGHSVYAKDIKTYAKLVAAHEAAHDPDRPHVGNAITHTHDRRLS